jgi:thioredoxin reductase (NADPH)
VMVVGGGDSAVEAALALARQPVASVTVSYRGAALSRVRPASRRALEDGVHAGRVAVMFGTQLRAIAADHIVLDAAQGRQTLRNDAVIICVGGMLPTALLADVGVRVETKYGTA